MFNIIKKCLMAGFICASFFLTVDTTAQEADKSEEVAAEENNAVDDGKAVEKDKAADLKVDKTGKANVVKGDKKSVKREKSGKKIENEKIDAVDIEAEGLLLIRDGDFKYRRIPERKSAVIVPENYEADKLNPGDNKSSTAEGPDDGGKRGLFGFSAESTNYIAKGVLVFIIIIILVLYRYRSRGRHNKVLKRFP